MTVRMTRLYLGVAAALSFGMVSTAVAADEIEDRNNYCSSYASSECMSRMGYTTQECEALVYDQCLGGGSKAPGDSGPGFGPDGRDCTGGVDRQGNGCGRLP